MNNEDVIIGNKYRLLKSEKEDERSGALLGFLAGDIVTVCEKESGSTWDLRIRPMVGDYNGFTNSSNLEEENE